MSNPVHILIVEDTVTDVELAQREIRKAVKDCEFQQVDSAKDFMTALETFKPDLIVSDYNMPRFDGMTALKLALTHAPLTPFIVWTGSLSEDVAVECMKAGANNYIIKENIKRLGPAVVHALGERQLLVERKQAEIRYRALFEQSHDAIFILDFNGHLILTNQRATELLGYSSEELIGLTVKDISAEPEQSDGVVKRLMNGEIIPHYERLFRKKDGTVLPVEVNVELVRDNLGEPLHIQSIVHDITQRKQAEQKVREQDRHFRALIENSLDNISLLAMDGTLLWENPSVKRTLGYQQDEHVGRNIFDLMHPDDLERVLPQFNDLLRTPGAHQDGTLRLLHSDGTWRWIEAIATNLLEEPGVQAMVINYRDITERKQAEIEIQQRTDDLALLNAINEAVIRGEKLDTVVDLLTTELKRTFSSAGSTIYMLDPGGQSLTMQRYNMSASIVKKIEALIGGAIPLVRIPIKEGGFFHKVLHSNRGMITSEPHEIQQWMEEFTETDFLPSAARRVIRKLIPQIYKVLNIKSTIIVPLISDGKTIGLLDVSSPNLFTGNDLERIERIGRQLTGAIQRQQADVRIRESEQFLQSIQNALSAHIAILDETGTIVRVNAAWRKFGEQNGFDHRLHGIGMNYLDVCDSATGPYSEEASLVAQAIRNVIAGHLKEARFEYPCHSPNERRWFTLQITKFEDVDRLWIVLAHENITERKEAELQSAYHAHLLSNVRDAVLSFDTDFILTSWNHAAEDMYGWTAEEVIGRPSYDVLVTEFIGMTQEQAIAQLQSTGQFQAVVIHTTKDGVRLFVDARASALRDPNGELVYVAVNRDITERKQAENALQASEKQYRGIFEGVRDAIIVESLDGEILDVNQRACEIFGYSREEFLKKRVIDLVPSEEYIVSLSTVDGSVQLESFETVNVRSNGEKFPVEIRGGLYSFGDRDVLLVVLRDITESKQAEQNLQRSEARFRGLFENTPVAIWEEDFSELKAHLETLKQQGISDFRAYFSTHPEALIECAGMIKVIDVNTAAMQMYEAESKENLIEETIRVLTAGEQAHNLDDFVAIAEGKTSHGWEGSDETMTGKPLEVSLTWAVVPGYEADYSKVIVTTVDITKRKQAEKKLRSSEERFRQLAENIQEVFWMTDAVTGEELYISPASQNVWGRAVDSMLNNSSSFIDSVLPDDREGVLKVLEEQRRGKKTEMEYRITRPDGSVRWIWDRAFPIFDDAGMVVRLTGIAADITERKGADERLRESEKRYRGLFENLVIGFALHEIILDDKGKPVDYVFLEINPMFEKLTGIKAVDAIGRRVTEVLPGIENDRFIQTYGQVALTGKPASMEEYSSPLGKYFEINAYSLKKGQFAVTFSDITERRQVEVQLRKLSRAVEQSASTIVITDTDGNIEYVNPKFVEKTGYSFEEVIGQNPRILKSDHTPPEEYEHLWKTITSGEDWQGELLNRKKNGELYWESATISPIFNERNETTHFIAVKEDISERKRSEAEIKRHLSELEALYENGLAVSRLLEPREIGGRIINTFNRYLSWHHVTIRLLMDGSDELELVAFSLPHLEKAELNDAEQNFIKHISKVGQGLSGWVVQTGVPIRTGNVRDYPQYVGVYESIRSGLYMPLMIGKRVIGVISVESERADAFSEQDQRLLATLASQTAVAFENARLYQAAQQELNERRRVEKALRSSETHYRELTDSITDIFFELDQDMRYTHWNRASEILTGIAEKDAIGKTMEEIFGRSEEQLRIGSIYEGVLETHRPRNFETVFVLNRERHSFEINAYPSTRGVAVVAKDVTERKQAELLQQKRFELMEFSAHNTLDELMRKTMDEISELTGSEIGFFHFMEDDQNALGTQVWSTNAVNTFSVSVGEGMHRSVEQAGAWAEAVRQRRSVIHNDFESLPQRRGAPEGHANIVREMVIPVIRNEKIMAVMGVANKPQDYTQHDLDIALRLADYAWDITERKRMQTDLAEERNQLARHVDERTAELIKANTNLARALRVKDEFLANMSHELRTPLNAILGLSESLSEQIAGSLNEKQLKYITTIGESGHHLLSLINDILDLAKIEAGQITLDINKVDIHSVCQASLRMVKQLAQKKNQDVLLDIDGNVDLIWADERRLKQMLVNLLSNAVKFTPESKTLGLDVRGLPDENRVEFSIWDNGIGISEEDLTRLFKPFVQLDSGLARESTGTGLGLALVSQMARLHGGSVSVSSEPGKGSRFTVILPWEPALARDTVDRLKGTGQLGVSKNVHGNKKKILLVEDTTDVIMMIQDYLETAGYSVDTARDGIEGIEQAKQVRPDLILMDVQMPRMDGIEATKKLRSDPRFKYTPIVALTALAMPNDRERCIEAGMDEYISKPVNLRALTRIIQKCLSKEEEKTRPL